MQEALKRAMLDMLLEAGQQALPVGGTEGNCTQAAAESVCRVCHCQPEVNSHLCLPLGQSVLQLIKAAEIFLTSSLYVFSEAHLFMKIIKKGLTLCLGAGHIGAGGICVDLQRIYFTLVCWRSSDLHATCRWLWRYVQCPGYGPLPPAARAGMGHS